MLSESYRASDRLISDQVASAMETILSKGDRVEIIPLKDGVKVIHIKRKEIKLNTETPE